MRFYALLLSLFLFPLLGSAAEEAPAPSGQEQAELVLKRAKSLDDFLDQPVLVEEYYRAMSLYYGEDRFPRQSFDAILDQVRKAKEQIPGMKERLWETGKLGPSFTVEAAMQSSGRDINVEGWKAFVKDWDQRLSTSAAVIKSPAEAEAALKNLDGRLAEFERTLAGATSFGEEFRSFLTPAAFEGFTARPPTLNKSFRDALTQGFYEQARQDPATQALAASWLHEHLALESTRDLLHSNEPDLILDLLVNLRNKSKDIFKSQADGHRAGGLVLSALKSLIPGSKDLLESSDPAKPPLFPQRMVRTARGKLEPERTGKLAVDFKAPPRVFHTIFKGVPINECVGGACQSLPSLSVERWYSAGLDGTWFQQVERNGRNVGFVQMVPLANGEARAYSTDFGASLLRQRTLIANPIDGQPTPGRFLDLWYNRARRELPARNLGFLVSDNSAINNAGVKSVLLSEPKYKWGRSFPAGDWKHVDPAASSIVAYEKAQGKKTYYYGGNMVTDGTVDPKGKLSLLRPVRPDAFAYVAKNPRKLRALIENGSGASREPVLNFLNHSLKDNQAIDQTLTAIARDEKSPGATLAIATLIERDTKIDDLPALALKAAEAVRAEERGLRIFPLLRSELPEATRVGLVELMKENLRQPRALAALGEMIQRDPSANYQPLRLFIREADKDASFLTYLFQNVPEEAKALREEVVESAFRGLEKGRLAASEENLLALVKVLRDEKFSYAGSAFEFLRKNEVGNQPAVVSALVNLLETMGEDSHQRSSVWMLLRGATGLGDKDFDRLVAIYEKKPGGTGAVAMEELLRTRGSKPKLYRSIVNQAWEDFAASAGFRGWDYYRMQGASEILLKADLAKAPPSAARLKLFFSDRPSDSRAHDFYRKIAERVNALPRRGKADPAPLGHRAEVNSMLEILRQKDSSKTYEALRRLGSILEPGKYPLDLAAFRETLNSPDRGYSLKSMVEALYSREAVRQTLAEPGGKAFREAAAAFLRAHPEFLSAPVARAEPALAKEILDQSFEALLAKGGDAFEGYVSLLRDRPDLAKRFVAHHEQNRGAPLSYALPEIAPDYRLSPQQLDAFVETDGRDSLYSLRRFFEANVENATTLLDYGRQADRSRIVTEALEYIGKADPKRVPEEAIAYLAKEKNSASGIRSILRSLPAEQARPLAVIALKEMPLEIDTFDFVFPLTPEQLDSLRPAVAALDPASISQYAFQSMLKAGLNPPKPESFFRKEFFEGQEKSFLAKLFERDEAYLRRVIELLPSLDLSGRGTLKVLGAMPAGQGAKLVTEALLKNVLFEDYTRYEDIDAILALARRDRALSERIERMYAAHPDRAVPEQFEEYLPVFQRDKMRNALAEMDEPAAAIFSMKRGRIDRISPEVATLYADSFARDASLPKPARYLAAALAFAEDQHPAEMAGLLKEMMKDPAFAGEKRSFLQIATLGRSREAPSAAKVGAAFDLLTEATRLGAVDPFAYQGIFGEMSFLSSRSYPEKAKAYLAEAERRWGARLPLPESAEATVRELFLKNAESFSASLGEDFTKGLDRLRQVEALFAVPAPVPCGPAFQRLEAAPKTKKAPPAKSSARPSS